MSSIDSEYTQPTGRFANHAREYDYIEALPLSSALGAEIRGVDLAALRDAAVPEIEDALYHHKMLYFRAQTLSYDDQEDFTRRFGSFGVDAYTAGVPGHPNLQRVVKEAEESVPMVFGGNWHTDSPFLERPPGISILYGVDIPPYGGDTLWANTQLAYEALSDTMRSMIEPLRVTMSARRVLAGLRKHSPSDDDVKVTSMDIDVKERTLVEGSLHPLVRTHPKTGTRSLYVDPTYTVGIEGMHNSEAGPLVDFLCQHITQPIFQGRLRWETGTLAMWDNRSCVHHAFNDHDGFRREVLRTIVEGEVPA